MGIKLDQLNGSFRKSAESQLRAKPKPPVRARRGRMNKWESAYSQILESRRRIGEIKWWGFEVSKVQCGVGAFYCPDFTVVDAEGRTVYYEVKGLRRAAGIVRIKAAALFMPCHQFILVTGKNYQWVHTVIGGE